MNNLDSVKIEVFIPVEFVSTLQGVLGEIGAGRIGNYDHCSSVTNVHGYWRPLKNASPFQGKIGELEQGEECKLEVRCTRELVKDVVRAIRRNHPYEEPVINIILLANNLFAE